MYSADGGGVIKVWACKSILNGGYEMIKRVSEPEIRVCVAVGRGGDGAAFVRSWWCVHRSWIANFVRCEWGKQGNTVNHLAWHPSGRKLLVHTRDNRLRLLDLKFFAVTTGYAGLKNYRLLLRSCISPDGRMIMSGSEDGRVYVSLLAVVFVFFGGSVVVCVFVRSLCGQTTD